MRFEGEKGYFLRNIEPFVQALLVVQLQQNLE